MVEFDYVLLEWPQQAQHMDTSVGEEEKKEFILWDNTIRYKMSNVHAHVSVSAFALHLTWCRVYVWAVCADELCSVRLHVGRHRVSSPNHRNAELVSVTAATVGIMNFVSIVCSFVFQLNGNNCGCGRVLVKLLHIHTRSLHIPSIFDTMDRLCFR